jgi:hypothetical protein
MGPRPAAVHSRYNGHDLSGRTNRHAAELQARTLSVRHDRNPPELCAGAAGRCPLHRRRGPESPRLRVHPAAGTGERRRQAGLQVGCADHVSGRRDRHATELQAGRVGTGCLPGRSDRHAAQLPTRGTHDHGEVPRWPSRHAAELHGSAAGEVSGRSNRDATELQAGHRRAVPCGPDRHAAELQGAAAREMSCGPDRHAAELQVAAAGEMSCGPDRHTAELPPRSGTAMSHRPDRHAAELPACCGGADAACRPASDAMQPGNACESAANRITTQEEENANHAAEGCTRDRDCIDDRSDRRNRCAGQEPAARPPAAAAGWGPEPVRRLPLSGERAAPAAGQRGAQAVHEQVHEIAGELT